MSKSLELVPAHLRDFFAEPYGEKEVVAPVEHDGQSWLCLSDGRGLLAVPNVWGVTLLPEHENRVKTCLDILQKPADGATPINVENLRLFTGQELPVTYSPCNSCGGDGKCQCPRCDVDHDCGDCEGSGQAPDVPDPAQGIVCGVNVDRHRLARLLRFIGGPCKAGVVTLNGKDQKPMGVLRLVGEGWVAALSPLDKQEGDQPEYVP